MEGLVARQDKQASRRDPLSLLLLAACALTLGGAVWAALTMKECAVCSQASALLGGVNLAPIGIVFYTQLLAVMLVKGPTRYVCRCILGAVGAHLVLVMLLYFARIACPPCLLTAAGAGLMLSIACIRRSELRRQAAVMVPGLVLPLWLVFHGLGPAFWGVDQAVLAKRQALSDALERAQEGPPVPMGRIRLVIYHRVGCHLCRDFEEHVLPVIKKEYPRVLDIRYTPAWVGLPSPTVVVIGTKTTQFPTLPSVADLRHAITSAVL
jgi:hypothetical protein